MKTMRTLLACMLALALWALPAFAGETAPAKDKDWRAAAQSAAGNAKITNLSRTVSEFERGDGVGEFIVMLKKPLNAASDNVDLSAKAGKLLRRLEVETVRSAALAKMPDLPDSAIQHRYGNIFGFSVKVTPQQLETILANPEVDSVEPVMILQAQLAQGIPLQGADTYRDQYNGSGIAVAICDTGIDYNNTYLDGGTGGFPNSKVIGGYDTGENDADPMDRNGHGTACAGIVAGEVGNTGDYIGGVAYNAKLYAVKISNTSTGGSASSAGMIAGWDWCVTHQLDDPNNPIMIVSTSFGGGNYGATCDGTSPGMTAAVANAKAANMTIFASSGNDGFCSSMGWPACITDVISVGAVYDAAWGTYYPCIDGTSCAPTKTPTGGCSSGYYATDNTAADLVTSYSNSASFLDIFAPSNAAYTLQCAYNGSTFNTGFGGTSAACPYAAGAAAALQSAYHEVNGTWLTMPQVKSYIIANGDPVTDGKVAITKPRVNLAATLQALGLPPSSSLAPLSGQYLMLLGQ